MADILTDEQVAEIEMFIVDTPHGKQFTNVLKASETVVRLIETLRYYQTALHKWEERAERLSDSAIDLQQENSHLKAELHDKDIVIKHLEENNAKWVNLCNVGIQIMNRQSHVAEGAE